MAIDYEKLKYMLHIQRFDIELLIENVLEDSEEDPHYSAVTATNLVKCYIEMMRELGENLLFLFLMDWFGVLVLLQLII